MLNTIYGWHLKGLGCVFDTLTFAQTTAAHATDELGIEDAVYGEVKKLKISTFNFIITRIFSVSPSMAALEVEVFPDGDMVQGFISIIYSPRAVEPTIPIILTMGLQLNITNDTGVPVNTFVVFEGFWIPKTQMPAFEALCTEIATSQGGTQMGAGGGYAPAGGGGMGRGTSYSPSEAPPYCKPRRY